MSFVIRTESLLNQWNGQVQNRVRHWIDFDKKYNKFIYGLAACGKKLQLVAQSVLGGDAVVLQEVNAGLRCKTRFTGVVTDEVVAVVVGNFSWFYLFSLSTKPVEKYEVQKPIRLVFGRGVLVDGSLFYSPTVGFFNMVNCAGDGQFMYRYIFDDVKKTCEFELVTKYPGVISYLQPLRRYSGNDDIFCVFQEEGDVLNVYDFQKECWSKEKLLRNAPLFLTIDGTMVYGRSLKGVATSEDGNTVAIFFKQNSNTLQELVGNSWQTCSLADSENFPGQSFCSRTLCTGSGVYVDGGNGSVMIIQQSLSLRDIAIKKVVSCWNPTMPNSFQSFIVALNLPTLIVRVYFGLNKE